MKKTQLIKKPINTFFLFVLLLILSSCQFVGLSNIDIYYVDVRLNWLPEFKNEFNPNLETTTISLPHCTGVRFNRTDSTAAVAYLTSYNSRAITVIDYNTELTFSNGGDDTDADIIQKGASKTVYLALDNEKPFYKIRSNGEIELLDNDVEIHGDTIKVKYFVTEIGGKEHLVEESHSIYRYKNIRYRFKVFECQ